MSNSVRMKVGFIGLGRMGRGMARRIFSAGHDLVVYDVVREATAEFASAGAQVASTIAEVCKDREVVVTMLVEDATVLDVALSKGGMRDSLSTGAIHLAMGTYGVATIRALAAAHSFDEVLEVAAFRRAKVHRHKRLALLLSLGEKLAAFQDALLEIQFVLDLVGIFLGETRN